MKKVFVAMSGGVDSSVAAALMKKSGFNVVGVFMKPWSPDGVNSKPKTLNSKQTAYSAEAASAAKAGLNSESKIQNSENYCLWKQDREDALRVAAKLEIPLLTWDFSKEYGKYVAEYMINGYKEGITPNPDVMCNKFIKFGVFLDKALKLGADYIATGHYARVKRRGPVARHPHSAQSADLRAMGVPHSRHPFKLLKASDLNKDQSYFLYTLTQKQLSRCLFPIGDYTKPEVRRMAKKFGLPNWAKKDSQGVCFVGPLKMNDFLKKYIKPQKGPVIRKNDGQVLGEHNGAWFYTIGQRHGMALSVGKSYYVVGKDLQKNVLYVDSLENLKFQFSIFNEIPNPKLQIEDFSWVGSKSELPLDCKVKTRYRQKDLDCRILKNGADKALVEIKEANIPIAPGQAAVFYKGDEVLGGGVIV